MNKPKFFFSHKNTFKGIFNRFDCKLRFDYFLRVKVILNPKQNHSVPQMRHLISLSYFNSLQDVKGLSQLEARCFRNTAVAKRESVQNELRIS